MKCRHCGAAFEKGTLFCPKCGKEVQWVPEYNTLETFMRQKEHEEQEKKRREMEARKEKEEKETERKRKKKKHKKLLAGIIGGTVVSLCIAAVVFICQIRINSFDYQMDQAQNAYAGEKFDTALRHLARAEKLEPDSLETKILKARIYMDDQNEAGAEKILLSVAEKDPDSAAAYGELVKLYERQKDYTSIRDLMRDPNESIKDTYQSYVCGLPRLSQKGGSYNTETRIEIQDIPSGTEVYYTLDGSDPDESSQKYESAIELNQEGTFTFKYIAYNEKQIPSEIGKEEYTIGFEAPDRPLIAPVSGKYDYLENIIITVPEGCTVYYAFDEVPTLESSKYTEPVPMQKGEHTFSAIAVDGRGKSSPVTSAVYVYYG